MVSIKLVSDKCMCMYDSILYLSYLSHIPSLSLSHTHTCAVPAAPRQVTVMDIGPTSVRLEWVFGDDGGAPVTHIHVEFITLNGVSGFVDITIEPGQSSALIEGLKDNYQYQLGLQARNRIGE